jgi:hypothetical protein
MPSEPPDLPEPPDRGIKWSIYVLGLASFCLVGGGAAPFLHLPGRGTCFWIAVFLGAAIGFVVNLLRPLYDRAVGRWRTFYDFLLRQMPPLG